MTEESKFKVDYAASGRSQCAKCRQVIPMDHLRIGPMVQSDKGDFKYPRWHHMKCFIDSYLPKNPGQLNSVGDVSGLDKLTFGDAKKIRALLPGGAEGLQPSDPSIVKEEMAIAKQNDKIWAMKAKLESMDNQDLQELLEYNQQPNRGRIFGGRNNMLDRTADGMVFGAIPKCSLCKDGDLILSHGQYKCTGALDEFSKCTNVVIEDSLTRSAWRVPEGLKETYAFLKTYRYKVVAKVDTALLFTDPGRNPSVGPLNASQPITQGMRPPKRTAMENDNGTPKGGKFLSGITVGCAGKLSKAQKFYEDQVVSLGGIFDKGSHVTVMITSEKDAAARTLQKLLTAVDACALVVSEDWLAACVSAQKVLLGDEAKVYRLMADPSVPEEGGRDAGDQPAERVRKRAVVGEAPKKSAALEKEGITQKSTTKKLVVKGSAAVEPESGVADKTHVYERTKGKSKEVFSRTMSRADITTQKNSYYILQLLEEDSGHKWYVFRKWGKVGHDDIGGTKLTEYATLTGALKEFEKTYLDKTGNEWGGDPATFVKHYDKFQPLEIDYGAEEGMAQGGGDTAKAVNDYKGTLDSPTQNLISLLFDIKAMNTALKEMNIDTTKMPLGKLSAKTIQEGFSCLSQLQQLLTEIAGSDNANVPKIVSLSNKFYTFIPHQFSDAATMLLDSTEKIEKMTKLLETLREMEVASKIMSGGPSTERDGMQHPIDVRYQGLKTDLKSVARTDPAWKMVSDYVTNTHAATHTSYTLKLVDLWEVDRHGEGERYAKWKDLPNRQLLWHGSRLTNWVGILSQGLRIAPPEAPTTGYMFGKGVYFADMVSKSANYCFTSSESTTGILVLSEVALGNMKRFQAAHYVDGLEAKYQSTIGEGRVQPDPAMSHTMLNGCVVPLGKAKASGIEKTTLQYNEFIVYDTAQIRMRYLLRLEFVYKGKCGTFF